ncbi:hypothetical protein BHM03_00004384 [Ensete ventricosum]|nr:hypothetical protein BHM03_00004384 [Ensete ventricosum]
MQPTDGSKEHNCIPDEHYVQTLIAVSPLCTWFLAIQSCYAGMVSKSVKVHSSHFIIQHKGLEGEITRRTLTHTLWDLSSSKDRERRGWHPVTYKLSDATPTLIQNIKVCAILASFRFSLIVTRVVHLGS